MLIMIACMSLTAQNQILLHSFNTGTARSIGNNVSVISLLGQTINGTSSGNGIFVQSGITTLDKGSLTGVKNESVIVPIEFALHQNYPNPFNPSTIIGFTLQQPDMTTLKVYDILGKEVATLVNERLEAGVYHQRTFSAGSFATGIYFYVLRSGNNSTVRKMLLMK